MRKILCIALLLLCMVGTASAYNIYLKCPTSVQAGLPLKCTLDSSFPPGTTFTLSLYQSQYTATQIKTQKVTVQADHKTMNLITDTDGLPGGQYKMELEYNSAVTPSSDSITLQLITIIDRSDEIEITSPVTQNIDGALRIEGEIKDLGDGGVELEVNGPDGRIYGPQWIGTKASIKNNAGIFTQKVDVTSGGDYTVDFSDAKGYIGTKYFTVVAPTTVATTVPITTAVVKITKTSATTIPTPWPTTAKSPLSPLTVLVGIAGAGMLAVLMSRKNR
ncbi:hypothetical protein [Methanoregula sp.]|uniref:hypothetical protein n=1 Tax=Methanoregula sp. TaxID=2052170 RepID=UPI00237423CD|nr:hypothetical protein [Methanoregula sp.]MDD1686087.1 hypothetical protein [Methanoregula sp.]